MKQHDPACPCCGADGRSLESGGDSAVDRRSETGVGLRGRRFDRRTLLRSGAGAAGVAGAATLLRPALRWDPASAATHNLNWTPPKIVTRAQWGANERLRNGAPSYDSVVEKLVVHHTVTQNHRSDGYQQVRNIYGYHTSHDYIDIVYHFLIDGEGRIYEGRWASDYPPGTPHIGESSKRRPVRGAHSLYFNDRSIGIALIGTYDYVTPSAAMIDSLVDVLAWKCARWGINPLGHNPYVNSQPRRVVTPNIVGHRDIRQTACPGKAAYSVLPTVRNRVEAKLAAGRKSYWVVARNGRVLQRGASTRVVTSRAAATGVVAATAPSKGAGLWLLSSNGRVVAESGAHHHGDASRLGLRKPAVGLASSASGRGYYIVASDGGVFTFGDAKFMGSMGRHRLNAPMIALVPTPTGKGYWTLARDGGVFSFGDAKFCGSAAPCPSTDPAVAMIASRSGKGYWIVQRSGKIRNFGDAGRAAFVARPTAPIVALHRGGGGLIGVASNGTFVHTPSAPAITPTTRYLAGAPAVAIVGAI